MVGRKRSKAPITATTTPRSRGVRGCQLQGAFQVSIEGDLVSKADGQFQPFVLGLGHYHGVEDGEAWSEGSRSDDAFVSSQKAGTYSLRLEVDPPVNGTLHVRVAQGVARMQTMLVALIALLAFPIGVGVPAWRC